MLNFVFVYDTCFIIFRPNNKILVIQKINNLFFLNVSVTSLKPSYKCAAHKKRNFETLMYILSFLSCNTLPESNNF